MSAWIILLFFMMGNSNCGNSNCGCSGQNSSCRDNGGYGRDRDRDRDFERGRDRDRDGDCGCNEQRFEPRFDARPFGERETCGCEENNN